MAYYKNSSVSRTIEVDGQVVVVDSKLEEKVLRRLVEEEGFSGRWLKPDVGLSHKGKNYTPDLELSVQKGSMTHRAIVEIKPDTSFFSTYIARRMCESARYYGSPLLLLYSDRDSSWYSVDSKTGVLHPTVAPVPGAIPINKLYKPFTSRAKPVYNHTYKRQLMPFRTTTNLLVRATESVLLELTKPGKKKSKRRRSTRRRR